MSFSTPDFRPSTHLPPPSHLLVISSPPVWTPAPDLTSLLQVGRPPPNEPLLPRPPALRAATLPGGISWPAGPYDLPPRCGDRTTRLFSASLCALSQDITRFNPADVGRGEVVTEVPRRCLRRPLFRHNGIALAVPGWECLFSINVCGQIG